MPASSGKRPGSGAIVAGNIFAAPVRVPTAEAPPERRRTTRARIDPLPAADSGASPHTTDETP